MLTVDLFMNLEPFSERKANEWGSNVSIAWIEELVGYEMVTGDRGELCGYPEFSVERILSRTLSGGSLQVSTQYSRRWLSW